MTPAKKSAVGSLFAMPLSDGQFGACQVVGIRAGKAIVATLDWIGRKPPTKAALAKAKILRADHHAWRGEPEVLVVDGDVPPSFVFVGEAPARSCDEECGSGGWSAVPLQILLNWRWQYLIPAKAKRAYSALASGQIDVDLGAGPSTLAKASRQLALAPSSRNQPESIYVALPPKPDFSALDRFNKLTEIAVEGPAPGLLEYLSTRPIVGKLHWTNHGCRKIDLGKSWLRELTVGWTGTDLTIALPEQFDTLSIVANGANHGGTLTVRCASSFELELISAQPDKIGGCERVTGLVVLAVPRLKLAPLARQLPAIQTLRIGSNSPTKVVGIKALATFQHLEHLTLYNVYDLEPAALPTKSLRNVSIDGTRASIVPSLKARLGGVSRVEIRGARTDRWISENADNPFRRWQEDGAPAALTRDAVKAWKQALGAIDALGPRASASAILRRFITIFNQRESDIDTIRAEEIADAFDTLVAHCGSRIDARKALVLFDSWRTF